MPVVHTRTRFHANWHNINPLSPKETLLTQCLSQIQPQIVSDHYALFGEHIAVILCIKNYQKNDKLKDGILFLKLDTDGHALTSSDGEFQALMLLTQTNYKRAEGIIVDSLNLNWEFLVELEDSVIKASPSKSTRLCTVLYIITKF